MVNYIRLDQFRLSAIKRAFLSIYSYTILFALFGVFSLSYHACFNSSLSTLEKRFHFSSTTGGYIMITDNVATILTNLFIGYFGKNAHRPKWMSIGCIVTGLSILLTSAPYFIYGPAQEIDLEFAGNKTTKLLSRKSTYQTCNANMVMEDCSDTSKATMMTAVAVTCFAVSNFFRGFGTSIYFTFGTPYLDDNVSKAKMPTFFAFIFATRILGAPLGFTISSIALKFYENPFSVPPGLSYSDPRWIGAWWIGFIFSGVALLVLAIPLSLFPREFRKDENDAIPMAEQLTEIPIETEDAASPTANENDKTSKKSAKEELSLTKLPGEVFEILKNPIVVCQMMGNTFRGIGLLGYFVFQPKYIESQFRQSASRAGLVSGTTGFMAKILGVLLGGFTITLFRPGPRTLTTYIFLVELTSVFTLLYASTIMGPQYLYPQTQLDQQTNLLSISNKCNSNCHCENARYQPVCEHNDDMKAYFSPCHAGCHNYFKSADNQTVDFTNCDCIDSPTKQLEKCPTSNDALYYYATVVALGGMISGSSRSGNLVTFFRSIRQDQKSLAVAVASFSHSLLVSIPYPIIYGKIFDYCCLVWSSECGKRGNCWLYDVDKLRKIYHTLSLTLVAMGSVFDLIMIFLSSRLGKLYDDEDLKKKSWAVRSLQKIGLIKKDKFNEKMADGPGLPDVLRAPR